MATKRGILGQSSPPAVSLTDVYTVPALKNATVRVIVTNRVATPATFRVSVAPGGAADNVIHYIAYDTPIAKNDTGSTVAFMLDTTDVVRVRSSSGSLSFTVTGLEQDQ